jgi:hypothetical protein
MNKIKNIHHSSFCNGAMRILQAFDLSQINNKGAQSCCSAHKELQA